MEKFLKVEIQGKDLPERLEGEALELVVLGNRLLEILDECVQAGEGYPADLHTAQAEALAEALENALKNIKFG